MTSYDGAIVELWSATRSPVSYRQITRVSDAARLLFGFGVGTSGLSSPSPVVRLADHRHLVVRAVMALIFCLAAGAIEPARAAELAANVDDARLVGADKDPANWMTYGRTYSGQPLQPRRTL